MSCSHISELHCSRTWRRFSRAAATQEIIDEGLARSSVRRWVRVVGVDLAIFGSRHLQRFEQTQPAARSRLPETDRGAAEDRRRSGARCARRARGSGSSSTGCRRLGRASGFRGWHSSEIVIVDHHARSTQVSLLPPPCEEFTTSDPRRSATRVRPPGTSVTFSP